MQKLKTGNTKAQVDNEKDIVVRISEKDKIDRIGEKDKIDRISG